MIFNYKYAGSSKVDSNSKSVGMSFVPDTFREPTFFKGSLNKHIPFREAISALHDVVISDLRFKPKDKTEYKAWVKEQEELMLGESLEKVEAIAQKVSGLRKELATVRKEKNNVLKPYYSAQRKYFNYLYKKDRDAWWVLDPVITVHPDELFFECFSEDESSYGKLGCSYNVFKDINEYECGTTNIDYSAALYNEFQKIRDYKETQFEIDPSGFTAETTYEQSYKEVKIDLPDSWVRGFLQVSSAMTMPASTFDLHPMDLYNFCFILRRNKEKEGPRSMRYILKPGQPIKVIFEPWNTEVVCGRSIYQGQEEREIRVWGRRRLLILERLIPIAKKFTISLMGSGLPSFYVADLGDMNFTLGLSGWTANDWSRVGNFDLMAPRLEVDSITQQQIYTALKENWHESAESLSKRLNLDTSIIHGALSAFTQAGRAIFDMDKKEYRIRELSRERLPVESLRFANDREESANRFITEKAVKVKKASPNGGKVVISGTIKDRRNKHQAEITIDRDERLSHGQCNCNFYNMNKLYKGPCEHMIALRIMHRLQAERI